MVSALNNTELVKQISKRYDRDEKRIVGIVLARYDIPIVQKIIESCYKYWNENTGKFLDLFWAGYGEYLCPDEEDDDKIILKFKGNNSRIYYDRKAFITIKNEFNKVFKKSYKDKVELILVNYRDGKLIYDESLKIYLDANLEENLSKIREIMEFITFECSRLHDVKDLRKKSIVKI